MRESEPEKLVRIVMGDASDRATQLWGNVSNSPALQITLSFHSPNNPTLSSILLGCRKAHLLL